MHIMDLTLYELRHVVQEVVEENVGENLDSHELRLRVFVGLEAAFDIAPIVFINEGFDFIIDRFINQTKRDLNV